jgi:hypothetical protein
MKDLKIKWVRAETTDDDLFNWNWHDNPVENIRMVFNTDGQIIWINAKFVYRGLYNGSGDWVVNVIDTSKNLSLRVHVDLLDCFGNELPRMRPSDGLVPFESVVDNLNKELIAEVMSRYDHGRYEPSLEHPIGHNWQWHGQVTNSYARADVDGPVIHMNNEFSTADAAVNKAMRNRLLEQA